MMNFDRERAMKSIVTVYRDEGRPEWVLSRLTATF